MERHRSGACAWLITPLFLRACTWRAFVVRYTRTFKKSGFSRFQRPKRQKSQFSSLLIPLPSITLPSPLRGSGMRARNLCCEGAAALSGVVWALLIQGNKTRVKFLIQAEILGLSALRSVIGAAFIHTRNSHLFQSPPYRRFYFFGTSLPKIKGAGWGGGACSSSSSNNQQLPQQQQQRARG
jgi:hypothetical protein